MDEFRAYRVFSEDGTVKGRLVRTDLDALGPGDTVIQARFSSVNYKDSLAATGAGKIMTRFPLIGGIEVAGTVVSSESLRLSVGDSVLVQGYGMGVSHDGGFSEYVRVPSDWVIPIPEGLDAFKVMAIGVAGFTAALSVMQLEKNGLAPDRGPVIVTGATGGVGTMAVQILAGLGYEVVALTGKEEESELLTSLGAARVLDRHTLEMGTRPLEKGMWAGAVDPVGGDVLAWLTRTMNYGASIASSGLAGGSELHTTVMPFILRGVNLLGIESSLCPEDRRLEAWRRLASDMRPKRLDAVTQEVTLEDLPDTFETLLAGKARGRFVLKL